MNKIELKKSEMDNLVFVFNAMQQKQLEKDALGNFLQSKILEVLKKNGVSDFTGWSWDPGSTVISKNDVAIKKADKNGKRTSKL